jgi:hypothetical protein
MDEMGTGDHFITEVRTHMDEWHAAKKRTKDLEEKGKEDPYPYASLGFWFIRGTRRHIRRLLRKRFGVKVRRCASQIAELAGLEPAENVFHGFGMDRYVSLERKIESRDREEDEGDY